GLNIPGRFERHFEVRRSMKCNHLSTKNESLSKVMMTNTNLTPFHRRHYRFGKLSFKMRHPKKRRIRSPKYRQTIKVSHTSPCSSSSRKCYSAFATFLGDVSSLRKRKGNLSH